MTTYRLFRTVRLNTELSAANGFGDYPDTDIVEVGVVEATSQRKAQNAFKSQFPDAWFSVRSAAWFVMSDEELAESRRVVDLGD